MHITEKLTQHIKQEWGGNIFVSPGDTNAHGTIILFKAKLEAKITETTTDNEGRITCVYGEVMDKN